MEIDPNKLIKVVDVNTYKKMPCERYGCRERNQMCQFYHSPRDQRSLSETWLAFLTRMNERAFKDPPLTFEGYLYGEDLTIPDEFRQFVSA